MKKQKGRWSRYNYSVVRCNRCILGDKIHESVSTVAWRNCLKDIVYNTSLDCENPITVVVMVEVANSELVLVAHFVSVVESSLFVAIGMADSLLTLGSGFEKALIDDIQSNAVDFHHFDLSFFLDLTLVH
ncbi:hypothetical protein LguiB_010041 [Lonicera macranthoides]